MKITAKVVYKDNTHKRMMWWYDAWMNVYKQFVEDDNRMMIDHVYDKLINLIDVLYFTYCIEMPRKKYLEHEVNKVRGWA